MLPILRPAAARAVLAFALALPSAAQDDCPDCGWDQVNVLGTVGAALLVSDSFALTQGFVPEVGSLDIVELTVTGQVGVQGQLAVRILKGGAGGPVLGESLPTSLMLTGTFGKGQLRLEFEQSVPLVPGNLYTMEFVNTGASSVWVNTIASLDSYPAGEAIHNGVIHGSDLWFRTGSRANPLRVVDQVNTSTDSSLGSTFGPVGQSFIANGDWLDVIEVRMSSNGAGGLAMARVFESSPGGALLAESESVAVQETGGDLVPVRFVFDQPVPLPSSGRGYFEVEQVGVASLNVANSSLNPYPLGNAFVAGAIFSTRDLWFRLGASLGPIEVPGQPVELEASTDSYLIGAGQTAGQRFLNSADRLDAFEVTLAATGSASSQASIRLRQGSPTGPVLAVTEPITITSSLKAPHRFQLSTPIATQPNFTYILEVVHESGPPVEVFTSINDYFQGYAYYLGVEQFADDLAFRAGWTGDVIEVEDQVTPIEPSGWTAIGANEATVNVGQEFVPQADQLDRVEVYCGSQHNPGAQLIARIRTGTLDGTIVGVSEVHVIQADNDDFELRSFLFPQPVVTNAGDLYVLEIEHVGGPSARLSRLVGDYPHGQGIVPGASSTSDFVFRMGMSPACIDPGTATEFQGCTPNLATLEHTGPVPSIGDQLQMKVGGGSAGAVGLVYTTFSNDPTLPDCGTPLGASGELLIDLASPTLTDVGLATGPGTDTVSLQVPDYPCLTSGTFLLQGFWIDAQGALQLTNGLALRLGF